MTTHEFYEGHKYIYVESGSTGIVRIDKIADEYYEPSENDNPGEAIYITIIKVLCRSQLAPFKQGESFRIWRTNGEGRAMCGWSLTPWNGK